MKNYNKQNDKEINNITVSSYEKYRQHTTLQKIEMELNIQANTTEVGNDIKNY